MKCGVLRAGAFDLVYQERAIAQKVMNDGQDQRTLCRHKNTSESTPLQPPRQLDLDYRWG
jgi:hypothetical protein